MTSLPDAAWCTAAASKLAGDAAWQSAVVKIGEPLFIKVKTDDEAASVLLAVGDGKAHPAVTVHPGENVEGKAIIVSMKHDTWDRLLSGRADLMTAFMSREIKAKASMFTLMKITDPAETLINMLGKVRPGGSS